MKKIHLMHCLICCLLGSAASHAQNKIFDTDANTVIYTEKTFNEDAVRIDLAGNEKFVLKLNPNSNTLLELLDFGNNTFIGMATPWGNTGFNNTALGVQTMASNTVGSNNTAVGQLALAFNNSGSGNAAFGESALNRNTVGNSNTAVGASALYSNTTTSNLVAIGDSALFNNGIGAIFAWESAQNTAVGSKALLSNTVGSANTALGFKSLYSNTSGYQNNAIGYTALYANTIGYRNNALGYKALQSNTSGANNNGFGFSALAANTTGSNNVAMGTNALSANTTGTQNTAVGFHAMLNNITGVQNVALGGGTLAQNKSGNANAVVGYDALGLNTYASQNVALGSRALFNQSWTNSNNEYAPGNVAVGYEALFSNNPTGLINNGNWNVGVGRVALRANTTGAANVGIGGAAGDANATGNFNTYLGHDADVNAGNRSNGTALGYQATITASNQVRVGNGNVTSIGGQVAWTSLSDARFKKNVKENVPGRAFINRLRPVTYHLDIEGFNRYIGREKTQDGISVVPEASTTLRTGFLAQEVEKAAHETGFDFDGVDKPQNDQDIYGLRYAEFTVPLVKAVQELDAEITTLKLENSVLKQENAEIASRLEAIEKMLMSRAETSELVHLKSASLLQNIPNPFTSTTEIQVVIPIQVQAATLRISHENGRLVEEVSITERGETAIQFNTNNLSAGVYYYSLLLDGKTIDTKKMVLVK
jgi:trimeric autotransporter adhesin